MNLLRLATALVLLVSQGAFAASLKVFTDRPQDRIQKALDGFTAQTGVQLEVTVAPYAELKAKLQAGEVTDILLLKDPVLIADAAKNGFFQAMDALPELNSVDASMRDPKNLWSALTYRVRSIAYDPSLLSAADVKTYEGLAGPALRGQLCIRNAKEYMPTMVAWLVARFGEAKARDIVEGWKANLATGYSNSDTVALQSIESGACTAAISNHYYLARLKTADQNFPVAFSFAEQNDGGLHTSGYGGGLAKGSKQGVNGNAFMAYMLSPAGQKLIVAAPSFEYPAVAQVQPEQTVVNFGTFKISNVHWSELGANLEKANAILEKAEWAK